MTSVEEQRVRDTFFALKATAEALAASADAAATAARQAYTAAERDAVRAEHRATQRAAADASQAVDDIATVIRTRISRVAPGLATAPFTHDAWLTGEWLGHSSKYIRLGTIRVDEESPGGPVALLPLLDSGNVVLMADPAEYPSVLTTLRNLLLRVLATAPAGWCELIVFDPKIRGTLSPFAGLRQAQLFDKPIAIAPELLEKLHEARNGAQRVAEHASTNEVSDLAELRDLIGVQPVPYRLFVLLDFPYGIDTAVATELHRLAQAGPHRGVSFLIHHDPTLGEVTAQSTIDPQHMFDHATLVSFGHESCQVSTLPGIQVMPDPEPPRGLIEQICAQISSAAQKSVVGKEE